MPAAEKVFRPITINNRSKHKTAASLRIELHYARLGIIARWDWDRFIRLAAFLNVTVYELASLILWSHEGVNKAKQCNRFPGPVCLLLTLLEAQSGIAAFTDDVVTSPIPDPHGPPQDSRKDKVHA